MLIKRKSKPVLNKLSYPGGKELFSSAAFVLAAAVALAAIASLDTAVAAKLCSLIY